MNLKTFFSKYGTEERCKKLVLESRMKQGVTCKHCESKEHYWMPSIEQFQCKKCRFRTTLRSGTILEASKLSYRDWVWCIFFMATNKKGYSAKEMQSMLGKKRYEPVWAMMHKIRTVMGNREGRYELEGMIEMDDAFFETTKEKKDKDSDQKRGRGSQRQSTVLVMTKVEPKKAGRPKKNTKNSAFRFVKMMILTDSSAEEINQAVREQVSNETIAKTDGWRGFKKLKQIIKGHRPKVVPPKEAGKALPWVHTMISNAKRKIKGINHSVNEVYLQNYLNEFCYKTNRRYFKETLFERFFNVAMEDTWYGKMVYKCG